MHRECRGRFPRHRLQRKPLISDPGMHHGTCVTHMPWCMSGSLIRGGGENVLGAARYFTYLVRGPWRVRWPPPDWLFNIQLMQFNLKEDTNLSIPLHCKGNAPETAGFSSQRASNEKGVSIPWRHPEVLRIRHGLNCFSLEYDQELWGNWNPSMDE